MTQININDLEQQWRQSLYRFSDKELLEIFPEAKTIIPEKIKEWEERRNKIIEIIKNQLSLIKERITDEFSRWFWREWVKVNEGQTLLEIDLQIARLKRLFFISKGRTINKGVTEEMIQQALTVPIENIISQHLRLRKRGRNFVGLCPFHNEKNPSLYIYPDTNSFYCYGCQKGGDIISLIELIYDYSFKEAVQFLFKY